MNRILFEDYALMRDKIFFFDSENHIPGKIDVNTGCVEYVKNISGYEITRDGAACCLIKKGKVYTLQQRGDAILIYDTEKGQCNYIPIDCGKASYGNFAFFCENEEELIIFPRLKNKILCLNITDNKMESIPTNGLLPSCGVKVENTVWLFPKDGNEAIIYHVNKRFCEVYDLKMHIEDVVACTNAGTMIYILNRYGIVYVLDTQVGELQQVVTAQNEHNAMYTVGKILFANGKLIILPLLDSRIKIMDVKSHEVEIYSEYPSDFMYFDEVSRSKYFGITEDASFYYLLRISNYMLKIKKDTGDFLWLKIITPEEIEKKKTLFSYGEIEFWEENDSEEQFISLVKMIKQNNPIKDIKSGSYIWKRIR